jgi:hypothetical protein
MRQIGPLIITNDNGVSRHCELCEAIQHPEPYQLDFWIASATLRSRQACALAFLAMTQRSPCRSGIKSGKLICVVLPASASVWMSLFYIHSNPIFVAAS